jgi:peptide/nickel transport system ATP-binding protein
MSAVTAGGGAQGLLEIRGLTVALPPDADRVNAVEDIHLSLSRNEVLCVVGESGSGKSVTAHAVMGLLPEPHVRIASGDIVFEGKILPN